MVPAFALGALDPAERARFERGLADCPELAAELAAYNAVIEALHFAAPAAQAAPDLLDRLMRAVNAEQVASPARRGVFRVPIRRISAMAASLAVLFVALIASNVYWITRVGKLEHDYEALEAQFASRDAILTVVASSASQRLTIVSTVPTTQQPPPSASVIYRAGSNLAVLEAANFPPLPPEKAYQIWLAQGGQRISAGLFQVSGDAPTLTLMALPQPFETYEIIGITPEPAEGSPGPTAPPVVRGVLRGG